MVSREPSTTAGDARPNTRPERESAHTPGPWTTIVAGVLGDQHLVCVDKPGRLDPVCVMEHAHPKAEANACLIAAAPDLLEALRAIEDQSVFNQPRYAEDSDTDYFLRCFGAVKNRARAAIAKATGQ